MEDPAYIPSKMIRIDDDKANQNKDDLRPGSTSPLSVDEDKVRIKFWFMEPVRLGSVKLTTATNVESFKVFYVTPESSTKILVESVCLSLHFILFLLLIKKNVQQFKNQTDLN